MTLSQSITEVYKKLFNVILKKMRDAVIKEFTGDQPVALISYYAVSELCMRLLMEKATRHMGAAQESATDIGPTHMWLHVRRFTNALSPLGGTYCLPRIPVLPPTSTCYRPQPTQRST